MIKIILTFLLMYVPVIALAKDNAPETKGIKSFTLLAQLPILDNGRLKPLDTYARNLLIQFSAKDTYERKPAILWLAQLLFSPESTKDDKVFIINNPDLAVGLGIEPAKNRRYNFTQLQGAYAKLSQLAIAAARIPQKERSVVEMEVVRVFGNVRLYADLSKAFAFAAVHPDFAVRSKQTARMLNLPDGQKEFSFLDIALKADLIRAATEGLEQKPPSQWSIHEQEIMGLLTHLFQWSMVYKDLPLGLIPNSTHSAEWLSPWDAIAKDFKNDTTRQLVSLWQAMAIAYTQGQQIGFDMSAKAYQQVIKAHVSKHDRKTMAKFTLENIYHAFRPFFVAKIFFIFALVLAVMAFIKPMRWLHPVAWGCIWAGFIPLMTALIARIIIMSRPPVSNLYETFIFVAWITVILGIIIERINKQWLGIIVAGISGTVLLFIASKYSAEGDTLQMLIAVLNSNFWLGTHVTTITMGYGATCVAGLLGHIWLVQACMKRSKVVLDNTFNIMMGILGLALTLTFLGTNLGGIWADQSWGRFWGWDPKENGALMIVIWSAMLFHARIAKMIGPVGMAVGNVLGMIVVMWAWFGVNLLSIGLHSYGFTSGIATTLLIYAVCEIIFVILTAYLIKIKK